MSFEKNVLSRTLNGNEKALIVNLIASLFKGDGTAELTLGNLVCNGRISFRRTGKLFTLMS